MEVRQESPEHWMQFPSSLINSFPCLKPPLSFVGSPSRLKSARHIWPQTCRLRWGSGGLWGPELGFRSSDLTALPTCRLYTHSSPHFVTMICLHNSSWRVPPLLFWLFTFLSHLLILPTSLSLLGLCIDRRVKSLSFIKVAGYKNQHKVTFQNITNLQCRSQGGDPIRVVFKRLSISLTRVSEALEDRLGK